VAFNLARVSTFLRYRASCAAVTLDAIGAPFQTRAVASKLPVTI
jgi:hypothetical protein